MKKIATLFLLSSLSACSSSDHSGMVDNGLSTAFPTDLAVTSPFATDNAVEGLVKQNPRSQTAPTEEDLDYVVLKPYEEKQQEILDRIEGKDSTACGFKLKIGKLPFPVSCYGPEIEYFNHPDAADCGGNPNSPPPLPTGDVGIWEEMESDRTLANGVTLKGGPCVVAKVNSLISDVQWEVDTAVDLSTSMLCAAKVTGKDSLPGVGNTKDFSEFLTSVLSEAGLPVTIHVAEMSREENTPQDEAVFETHISSTQTPNDREINVEVYVTHIAENDRNTSYRGRIRYAIDGLDDLSSRCDGDKIMNAASILYTKSETGRVRYRLQRSRYCASTGEPFDSDGSLDPSNKDAPGGWVENYNEGSFDIDSTTGAGSLTYAWQAGTLDSHTREFAAQLSADDGKVLSGCGYFGFGPAAGEVDVGSMEGMICNWAGPCNNHELNIANFVQRQCFTQNASTLLFESDPDSLNIAYAPTNSCNSLGAPFEYDGRIDALTHNLLDLSEMEANFSPPTPPDEL